MRRKGHKAPFTTITLILLFGKKKQPEENPVPPLRDRKLEAFPIPDSLKKTISGNDVSRARDKLRLVNLERDIIGDALTKIYEAEAKGQINESEKNQLLQRYKTDLKRVDSEIDTHKKTVDLYELESAKEDLLKSFHEKLMEIDLKINQIKPSVAFSAEVKFPEPPTPSRTDEAPASAEPTPSKEKQPREKPRNKSEERIESIREEVLKAMERLEQIETEG